MIATGAARRPVITRVPSGPVAAASAFVAHRLLRRAAARMPLRLIYPDGKVIGRGDATAPAVMIHHPHRLARRIGRHGLIGFGESYMAGEWDSADLTAALTVMAAGLNHLVPRWPQWLRLIVVASQPHPNYFGDACVWWGLWLITITAWWSLTTALSPLLMTYFLVYVTGARLTEKYMAGRPGFSEYQARTSFFVPRPPRCTPRSAQNDDRSR